MSAYVISVASENTECQTCYMGKELLVTLGANLGSFVRIQVGDKSTICQAWPDSDLPSNALRYRNTVYSEDCVENKSDFIYTNPQCNAISVLSPAIAKTVSVTVIISNLVKLREFKKSSSNITFLKKYCSNLLIRLCVAKSYVINCMNLNLKVASLYGISHIVINGASHKTAAITDGYVIVKSSDIIIDSIHSKEWFEQISGCKPTKQLGGLQRETSMLLDLIKLPLEKRDQLTELGVDPPHGILLRGPPGCGKTSIVQYVSDLCGACLITINGPELFAPLPGETEDNLRKLFEKAVLLSDEGPCILFIDEIDSVCPRKGKSGKLQESRMTGQFLLLMDTLRDKPNILVIAATNRPSALDPTLRRPGRFDREVTIGAPTLQQRREILETHTSGLPLEDDLDLDMLAGLTNGYVGADLAALCHEAAYVAMSEGKVDGKFKMVTEDHFVQALRKICPSLQKGSEGVVDLRPVYWSDIGGLDSVKTQIKQAVEWPIKHPEAFRRMGLLPSKGVLLYGPPGCCKTTLVRAAATACHATFLAISGAQLYSPYVGDSERLIAEVFQKARACAPAIILLDEIDSIVGKRSESGHSGVQERVLSALLNEMDGIGVRIDDGAISGRHQKILEGSHTDKPQTQSDTVHTAIDNSSVLVVAATNRPDLLDEALVRPGRIDKVVYVPHPDAKARKEILKIYSQNMNISEEDLDTVVTKTDFYTGADLENLCREAALCSLTEDMTAVHVTAGHLEQALKAVTPTLTPSLIQQYSNINMATFKCKMK